jgi:hypothetical protein
MAEQELNLPKVFPGFQKVGGPTVAQRLNTLLIICVLRVFTTVITLSSIMGLKL